MIESQLSGGLQLAGDGQSGSGVGHRWGRRHHERRHGQHSARVLVRKSNTVDVSRWWRVAVVARGQQLSGRTSRAGHSTMTGRGRQSVAAGDSCRVVARCAKDESVAAAFGVRRPC